MDEASHYLLSIASVDATKRYHTCRIPYHAHTQRDTDLQQSLDVGQPCVHASVWRKELDGRLHEPEVAGVGKRLIVQHDHQWSKEVAHALRVAFTHVSPHVTTHNVTDLHQVDLLLEVPDTMQT